MSTAPKKKKAASVSFAERAGTTLSPAYVSSRMKRVAGKGVRVSKSAVAFTAGCVDFLMRDVLLQVLHATAEEGVVRATASHVGKVIHGDEELNKVMGAGFIPEATKTAPSGQTVGWSDRKAPPPPAKKKTEPPPVKQAKILVKKRKREKEETAE